MASQEVRQRSKPSEEKDSTDSTSNGAAKPKSHSSLDLDRQAARISVVDILRVLGGILLLNGILSYFITGDSIFWGRRPSWTKPEIILSKLRGELLLTEEELSKYDGTNPTLPIYLALNGSIYDVSAGPNYYGPGGSYHFFAGRDSTRGFITGCFKEDTTPDLRGLEEMYVPLDLDEPPKLPAGAGETVRRKAKREWKIQRERARRLGRQRVNEIVTKWQGTFSGKSSNGKYWKVGRIKRDVDWESKLGPVRKLCDHAVSQRPKGGESYASIGDLFD